MVKVKSVAKSKAKPRQEQSMASCKKGRASSSNVCASKKVEGNLIPSCCECGEIIDNDTKAVQCEKCVENETWKCASCLDLSDEMYDQLATSTKSNLHWFCPKCENIVLNADVSSPNILTTIEQHLMSSFAKFEQELLDKVNASLQRKEENDLLESIECRLKKLEERPVVIEEFQRLEQKVDQLRCNMDEPVVPVVQAVQEALHEDKAEETEIDRRKTNVIVHGVSESDAQDTDRRIDDDITVLAAMFQEVKVENAKVESVVRLGKKAADPTQNPRPMKVVLDSVESKITLLKKAKNLREKKEGGWAKVFIHQDLTPKQREARKPLVAELKQRKANGETDLTIFNGKVVKKRGG